MKQQDKICHRISIKSQKEREIYKRRQERYIQGTPKLILGKSQPNLQEIWTDDLKNQPILKLKQANTSERAHLYAKTITQACCNLALHYGHFMINQNMIFFNPQKDIFAWINPDIRENHVKIYLPHTHEGELAMIRSIITYLKHWFKCDYSLLTEIKHLNELAYRIQNMKIKPIENFRPKSPEREFFRRNSVNMEGSQVPQRGQEEPKTHGPHLLTDNKSVKEAIGRCSSGNQSDNFLTSSLNNKMTSPLKFNCSDKEQLKNKTTLGSQKKGAETAQFQHRTFNNLSSGVKKLLNKSLGVKGGNSYFPNKTTSNKHHIVSLINQQDTAPNEYGRNKLLLDERKMSQLEVEWHRKGKESLDGIGQELNDLFFSNIENEQQGQENLKQIQQQFSNLLE